MSQSISEVKNCLFSKQNHFYKAMCSLPSSPTALNPPIMFPSEILECQGLPFLGLSSCSRLWWEEGSSSLCHPIPISLEGLQVRRRWLSKSNYHRDAAPSNTGERSEWPDLSPLFSLNSSFVSSMHNLRGCNGVRELGKTGRDRKNPARELNCDLHRTRIQIEVFFTFAALYYKFLELISKSRELYWRLKLTCY